MGEQGSHIVRLGPLRIGPIINSELVQCPSEDGMALRRGVYVPKQRTLKLIVSRMLNLFIMRTCMYEHHGALQTTPFISGDLQGACRSLCPFGGEIMLLGCGPE